MDQGPSSYDEMVTGTGEIRPHWKSLLGTMLGSHANVFAERVARARRQFQENGVSYNVYSDPRGADRPWRFDLLPLLIPAAEWALIERGLAQRASLLNLILSDLYGPQRLLHEHVYPPALVFANPRFLRPCHHLSAYDGQPFVHFYAADIVRSSDGRWWVQSDHLDAPAGPGYALENRIVMARVFPEAFRAAPVLRMRPFFDVWQVSLQRLAARHRDNPRMVLLTPGPSNETYFEHVYLARELGLTLVEGADLTVRDAKVYLKTLGGLQPVDVILRRQDSEYCDPLELRADSALGVAALMQAVRAGSVSVVNALGSGVAQTPALSAFLPQLARHCLGEDLAMSSVASWWCGQSKELEHVIGRLDEMVIRPTFPGPSEQIIHPRELPPADRETLVARMRERPGDYTAHERLTNSVMPIWTPEGLVPKSMVLRVYLVASEGGYVAMQGGLARVTGEKGEVSVSMQRGGISKDTWILAHGGGSLAPVMREAAPLELRRSTGEMQSRIADNLFWLGRYTERLDNSARLLRSAISRVALGDLGPGERIELRTVARLLAKRALIGSPSLALHDGSGLTAALTGAGAPNGPIQEILSAVQSLLPSVRTRLSNDLLHVYRTPLAEACARLAAEAGNIDGCLDALDNLVAVIASVSGLVSENMTRHGGWRFFDIGRKLERAQFTIDILRGVFRVPASSKEAALRLTLELCDSSITYRSRYLAALQAPAVLDLVMADDTNPRSLAFQLRGIADHLDALPESQGRMVGQPEQRLAHAALAAVWLFELELLSADAGLYSRIEQLLGDAAGRLSLLSEALTRVFFSHVKAPQSYGVGEAQK